LGGIPPFFCLKCRCKLTQVLGRTGRIISFEETKISENIIIVGAGLGGLTLALGLLKNGQSVQIFESAPTLEEVGAGISVPPNALKLLWRLGLKDKIAALACLPEVGEIRVGETGQVLGTSQFGDALAERYGAPYAQMHRADLQLALVSAVLAIDPNCLNLNSTVESCENTKSGAVAHVREQGAVRKVTGRALVACDGIRSAIRQQMFIADEARFTRHVAWRCIIPREKVAAGFWSPKSLISIGHRRQLAVYPISNGEALNCVAVDGDTDWTQESWSQRGDVNDLQALFSHFDERCRAVLSAVPADGCFKWAIYDRDPLESWCDGNIALLGDAAHPMTPYLGQGAAVAIEDAFVLARALSNADTISEAFDDYQSQRIERANWTLLESRAAGQRFQEPDADTNRFDNDQAMQMNRMFSYEPA
jgi:salicylate hydroxylase